MVLYLTTSYIINMKKLTEFQQKVHDLLIAYATNAYAAANAGRALALKTAKEYAASMEQYLPKDAKVRFGIDFPDTAYDVIDVNELRRVHDMIENKPEWKKYDIKSHGSTYRGGLKCLIAMREDTAFLQKNKIPEEISSHLIGTTDNNQSTKEDLVEGKAFECHAVRYERDRRLREMCINKYGCKCYVCGFDFEKFYGEVGKGFIEVHHLQPLSDIGEEHTTDPEKGLRPLCSNCHSMIHRHGLLSIEELVDKVKRSKR